MTPKGDKARHRDARMEARYVDRRARDLATCGPIPENVCIDEVFVGVHAVGAPGGAANQHERATVIRLRKRLRPVNVHRPQPERQRGRVLDPKRVRRKVLRLFHYENRAFGDRLPVGIGKHEGNGIAGLRTVWNHHPRGGLRLAFASIENDRYLVSADLQYILLVFVDELPRQRHVHVFSFAGDGLKPVLGVAGNHEFSAGRQVNIVVREPLFVARLHRNERLVLARLCARVRYLFAVPAPVVEGDVGPCAIRAADLHGKISGIIAGVRLMPPLQTSAIYVVLKKGEHCSFRTHPFLRGRDLPVEVRREIVAKLAFRGAPH